jgi:hypothetical protein
MHISVCLATQRLRHVVETLGTPHCRLTLVYCCSDTNSHLLTMERISEPPEDHWFSLQTKRTSGQFSLSQAINK